MTTFNNPKYLDLLDFLKSKYHPSATKGHFEFMMWLVNRYKPQVVGDIGCDWGHSSFAFASEGIGKIYSIDSFCGDISCGYRNTYPVVKQAYHDLKGVKMLPADNIEYIKGYFSDVAKTFDKKIDIILIDGGHLFENVKEDFETWFPKCNQDAIILFHDTVSFPDSVGKYFNSLPYPKTQMAHSAGLGVLSRNPAIIKEINDLWVNKLYSKNQNILGHSDFSEFNILKNF